MRCGSTAAALGAALTLHYDHDEASVRRGAKASSLLLALRAPRHLRSCAASRFFVRTICVKARTAVFGRELRVTPAAGSFHCVVARRKH